MTHPAVARIATPPRNLWSRARASYRPRLGLVVPDAAIEIDRLVSPLRYDVVVRQRHLQFLAEHLDLAERDFEAYAALAVRLPYYEWFRSVAFRRLRSRAQRDGVDAAFRRRLRATTELYLSFQERGFDPRNPLILRSSGPLATTATGKTLVGRCFPGDGCHRLALLRLAGHTRLEPDWYRIRVDATWSPPDNTHTLIRLLGLDATEYFRFLSSGYGAGDLRDGDSLLRHLRATDPERVAEVSRLIAVDRPFLADPAAQQDEASCQAFRTES